MLSFRRNSDELSADDKARLKRLSFNDYDETSLLIEAPDGYEYETVHADQEKTAGEVSDSGAESEIEPVDEGAVMALSIEDIRKMR